MPARGAAPADFDESGDGRSSPSRAEPKHQRSLVEDEVKLVVSGTLSLEEKVTMEAVHFADDVCHAAKGLFEHSPGHDKRKSTFDPHAWESLEDEASHAKFSQAKSDEPIKGKKQARTMTEDQVPFPFQSGKPKVWNPMNRYAWDALILLLIVAVMIIAPFEITYVSPAKGWGERLGPTHRGLFATNVFIDVCFLLDIFLALNTAYFDSKKGCWVVNRRRIFRHYLQSWLVPDVLSVIPYELLPVPKSIKILKMMKLVRLLKLLRVLKQPRIMSRLNKHCTIRAQAMTVLKYVVLVVFQIHWGACVLRAIDGVLLKDCPLADVTMRYHGGDRPNGPGHACPQTVLGFYRNQGIWPTYAAATAWTFGCMQGELNGNCVAELLLNFWMTLTGCIVLSFMVGDLCNAVTNMDPVRNDFILAFDSLNNYIDEVQPPPSLRYKLREFMSLSEVVFREDYHRSLLERLSPGLLSVVAQHNLARVVVQLPFYVDTIKRAYSLRPNARIQVKYPLDINDHDHTDEDCFTRVKATLLRIHPKTLIVDVVLDEPMADAAPAEGGPAPPPGRAKTVPMAWIDTHSYGSQASKDRMSRALYEENQFVVALTRRLTTSLFMPKDTLVRNDLSPVDDMYIVHSGRGIVLGRRTVSILRVESKGVNDVIGDDICTLLVGDKDRRRRHYTARAMTVLQVFVLEGDAFADVVDAGSFDEFKVGVRRYGCFLRVQRALVVHARARLRGSRPHHHGPGYSFADHHAQFSEDPATDAALAAAATPQGGDDDDAVEDDAVLSSLRAVQDDLKTLTNAPAAVQLHFASDNADLAALAPLFADLKRRVVKALAQGHEAAKRRKAKTEVVSSLEKENQNRSSGFQAAF